MSTAEKIFEKAQALPEPAQEALRTLTEMLAAKNNPAAQTKPQFGSARGLVKIGPEFDEPLEDFKPYLQ